MNPAFGPWAQLINAQIAANAAAAQQQRASLGPPISPYGSPGPYSVSPGALTTQPAVYAAPPGSWINPGAPFAAPSHLQFNSLYVQPGPYAGLAANPALQQYAGRPNSAPVVYGSQVTPTSPYQQAPARPSHGIRSSFVDAITNKLKKLDILSQPSSSSYMTPACTSFRHKPLPQTGEHFRLAEFAPIPTHQSPIRCKMHVCNLKIPPEYVALSYSVSEAKKSRRFNEFELIPCDGGHIRVYGGLLDILRGILDRHDPVYLWIDCFCIAQDDFEEKAAQIGMMKFIYGKAKETIIWLETSEDNLLRVNAGFEALRFAHTHYSEVKSRQAFQSKWASTLARIDEAALGQLLRKTWFSRVWMLQEAALSSAAVIYCCSNRIAWTEFCEQLMCLMQMGFLNVLMENYTDQNTLDNNYVWLGRHLAFLLTWKLLEEQRVGETSSTTQSPPKLINMMRLTRCMNATDLRDRVYALLGLCSDTDAVSVVYEEEYSVATLYHKLALYFTTTSSIECSAAVSTALSAVRSAACGCKSCVCPDTELSILADAGIRDWNNPALKDITENNKCALRDLPSWVPVWDYSGPNSLWYDSHTMTYNAGGDTKPSVWHDPDTELPRHLFVHGIITSCIRQVTRSCPAFVDMQWYMALPPNLKAFHRAQLTGDWLQEAFALVQQYQAPSPNRTEEFCRTLCANASLHEAGALLLERKRVPIANGRDIVRAFNDFMTIYEFVKAHKHLGFEYLSSHLPAFKCYEPGVVKWLDVSGYSMPRRTFFITEDGHVGLGPGLAQVGDEVCVFAGAPVPFVLRSKTCADGGEYQVLGEAYVHGLMDGEAFQLHPGREDWVCLV